MNKYVEALRQRLGESQLMTRQLTRGKAKLTLLHIEGLADNNLISQFVVEPLLLLRKQLTTAVKLLDDMVFSINVEVVDDIAVMEQALLTGSTLIFIGDDDSALSLDTASMTGRAITEPPTSGVTKGPREGFVENYKVNLSLIKRRLKTGDFKTQEFIVGKYTNTAVTVCYIDTIADMKVVNQVIKQIKKINIGGVIDSSYISKFLSDGKPTIFKMVGSSEKPDIVVSKLLEGRVAIIVDGSPIVITAPYMLIEDLQSPEDYYETAETATLSRVARLFSVIASMLLPGIYVSLQLHNYQIIPSKFLITIINATQAIPLNPLLEMFTVLILFDILREANSRMPRFAGLSLSVVGAIVLGDAAVRAGLLGAPAVMIGALSGIGLYTMPDNTLILSMLRLVFTLIGGIMGLYGMVLAGMLVVSYMISINTFKTPYMSPYAPIIEGDKKDAIIRSPIYKLTTRPQAIPNVNKVRGVNEQDK